MKRKFLVTEKGLVVRCLYDNVPDVILISKFKLEKSKITMSEASQDVKIVHQDNTIEEAFIYPNGIVQYGNREKDWDDKVAKLTLEDLK